MITIADKTFYVSAEANQQVTVMLPGDLARQLGAAISQAAEISQ